MKSSDRMDLTIIIPALNEGEHIALTLDEINRVLTREQISYEIIVVDDGSIDGTGLVAKEHGAHLVLKNIYTHGRGDAIKLGASKASGSIILTMNADGAYNPSDILKLIKPISEGKADLVNGSRFVSRRERDATEHLFTFLMRYYFRMIFWLYFGIVMQDVWSGFRAYRANLLKKLLKYPLSSDYSFDLEIPYLAKKYDYKVTEIPIRVRLRESFGHSRLRILTFYKMLFSTLRIFYKYV